MVNLEFSISCGETLQKFMRIITCNAYVKYLPGLFNYSESK